MILRPTMRVDVMVLKKGVGAMPDTLVSDEPGYTLSMRYVKRK